MKNKKFPGLHPAPGKFINKHWTSILKLTEHLNVISLSKSAIHYAHTHTHTQRQTDRQTIYGLIVPLCVHLFKLYLNGLNLIEIPCLNLANLENYMFPIKR